MVARNRMPFVALPTPIQPHQLKHAKDFRKLGNRALKDLQVKAGVQPRSLAGIVKAFYYHVAPLQTNLKYF
jgi:hypothetical protein